MKASRYLLYFIFLSVLLIAACKDKKQEQKVIATVNDTPITLAEFEKEIASYSKRQPMLKMTPEAIEDHLTTIIEKKLMIREAMKKGLAEDERFIDTIKTFWEQTLIRELINTKNKEWADRSFVTEDEIQKQYKRMQYRMVVIAVRAGNKEQTEAIMKKMEKGERIEGGETIVPHFYEDTKSLPLQNAFDMQNGEIKFFNSDGEYIVIRVVKKEKITLPPLNDIQAKIKESLVEQKKQKTLSEWMEELKKASKINIDTALLKAVSNGK